MQDNNHLFKDDNVHLVREIVKHRPVGLAIDIDGTISEIAPTPDEATVTEASKHWLAILAKQMDLVVAISGRSAKEARAMIGIESLVYLGNHGLERYDNDGVTMRLGAEHYPQIIGRSLEEIAGQINIQGVFIENKGITGAIHFRNAEQPNTAREAIIRAIRKSEAAKGLKVTEGKMVVELRPPVQVNKGVAIKEIVEEHKLNGVLYAGDDLTDVDAFIALRELRERDRISTASIAVLSAETPNDVIANADLVLYGISEVEDFLKWLSQEIGSE